MEDLKVKLEDKYVKNEGKSDSILKDEEKEGKEMSEEEKEFMKLVGELEYSLGKLEFEECCKMIQEYTEDKKVQEQIEKKPINYEDNTPHMEMNRNNQ